MFAVLIDDSERTANRMEAARWLAERGFGRAIHGLEIEVGLPSVDLTVLSTEDLEAILAIVEKYEPEPGELAAEGEIRSRQDNRRLRSRQR